MKLFIYALDNTVFEGEAEIIGLPTVDGEISVLNKHLPIVTALKKGVIKINKGKETKNIEIKNGFARINQEQTIILVTK
jgi:F-type H+-transporting ATPase subunit epsilon